MSGLRSLAVSWLVGLAWGALAAAPIAVRARRQRVAARLTPLRGRPARERPPSARSSLLGRVRSSVSAGTMGRVLAGWRAHRLARHDDGVLAGEHPVTLDLLAVAVEAGCTPYVAVELAQRWAPPATAARLT